MSISSKAIEVVNITNGSDVAVEMSYNPTLEGTPKPQARPRLSGVPQPDLDCLHASLHSL